MRGGSGCVSGAGSMTGKLLSTAILSVAKIRKFVSSVKSSVPYNCGGCLFRTYTSEETRINSLHNTAQPMYHAIKHEEVEGTMACSHPGKRHISCRRSSRPAFLELAS